LPSSTYTQVIDETESKSTRLLSEIKHLLNSRGNILPVTNEIRRLLEATLKLPTIGDRYPMPRSRKYKTAIKFLTSSGVSQTPAILFAWVFTAPLGKITRTGGDDHVVDFVEISRSWIDEWLLGKIISGTLVELGMSDDAARQSITLIKILVKHSYPEMPQSAFNLETLLTDVAVQSYMGINRYKEVLWFKKEAFEDLVKWLYLTSVVMVTASNGTEKPVAEIVKAILDLYDTVQRLLTAEAESGYQVEKLLEAVR